LGIAYVSVAQAGASVNYIWIEAKLYEALAHPKGISRNPESLEMEIVSVSRCLEPCVGKTLKALVQ
jgi:hypothetical protein